MDAAEPGVLSRRKRRAVAFGAAAGVVIVVASLAYLRPSSAPAPTPGAKPVAINPLETSIDTVTYDFPSASVGWALHYPPSGVDEGQFWVSRTVDGGRHWQVRMRGRGSFRGFVIRFFDKARGFVLVGAAQLYRTRDGGDNWTRLSLPVMQVSDAAFPDESHGWVAARPFDRTEKIYLYATEDAGDSWQRLPDPPDATSVLSVRSPAEAWLASRGAGPPRVYRSVDGGRSWQSREVPLPTGETALLGAPWWTTFVRLLPGNGVYVSAQCDCPSARRLDLTSLDGGATWRSVQFMSGWRPLSTAFQDDTHWWFIDARTLYRSFDAGKTWTSVNTQLPAWEFAPRAVDMTHGWARISVTGGYGLATTSDAGLHWTRVTIPQSN